MHVLRRGSIGALAFAMAGAVLAQPAVEPVDLAMLGRIRDEGLNRSQVMDHLGWLADVYGPRLTGSPGIAQAGDWVLKQFQEWNLRDARRERFSFGWGWSLERFSAHIIEPQVQPIIGVPGSWLPGTGQPIIADVVLAPITAEADFARYRGQLAGRIVLTQPARAVALLEGPIVYRMTDKDFEEAATVPPARGRGRRGRRGREDQESAAAFRRRVLEFYRSEGVVALFDRGSDTYMASAGSGLSTQQQRTDGGTVFPGVEGSPLAPPGAGLPGVTLAVEHYNRMVRILEKGLRVRVELDVRVRFHEEVTPNGFNLLAEIPGADPRLRDEIVIIGAHFDSEAAGTGATDNAAGSAAVMEAARILKAVDARPRRTLRFALWGGEEQGLLGSRSYVRAHFGNPATMALTPAHPNVSVYFNSDNGAGRIRGIWLQGNLAAQPIFEAWMAPLRDLGVVATGPRSVTSTDHVAFDEIGLPAFQFMVDRLEYSSRTHHSNMDTVDRVQRDDMIQHATVLAVFAYQAAMRDGKFPRKPLPKPAQ
ncbi:MAG TPA: M20/M25/M40 family metallo-hydrolase [Vicinamibacterales bacterium]|nr:M20/M25/M40 family metallo-hydrolase [Vicinamibacterales bacterium]